MLWLRLALLGTALVLLLRSSKKPLEMSGRFPLLGMSGGSRLRWHERPEDQGQHIRVEYALDVDRLFRRRTDLSDGSVVVSVRDMPATRFEPWNNDPAPKSGWRLVARQTKGRHESRSSDPRLDKLASRLRTRNIRLTDNLPTYGGPEPDSTDRVWSWDKTRILIGTHPDDLEIVSRAEAQEYL